MFHSLHLAHCPHTPTCRIIDLRVRKSLRKGNVHVSFHSSLKAANCVRIACALQHAKQMLAFTSSFLTHFLSKLNSFNENQHFKNTPHLKLAYLTYIYTSLLI